MTSILLNEPSSLTAELSSLRGKRGNKRLLVGGHLHLLMEVATPEWRYHAIAIVTEDTMGTKGGLHPSRGKKEVERLDCPSSPHRAHRSPARSVASCRHPAPDSPFADPLGSSRRNRRPVAARAAVQVRGGLAIPRYLGLLSGAWSWLCLWDLSSAGTAGQRWRSIP